MVVLTSCLRLDNLPASMTKRSGWAQPPCCSWSSRWLSDVRASHWMMLNACGFLVDHVDPHAESVRIVQDHLNTHSARRAF